MPTGSQTRWHIQILHRLRKENAVTVPDSYPLPQMEDCIDNIGSARFVTKLDMLKGYWQVSRPARKPRQRRKQHVGTW